MNVTINPGKVHGEVAAPPSKSYSHRALIAASLAEGTSQINNLLSAEDIQVTRKALMTLGIKITQENNTTKIVGCGGQFPLNRNNVILDCQDSGTSLRFLTAVASLTNVEIVLDGSPRLRKRPIGTLVRALTKLGSNVQTREGNYAPVSVKSNTLAGGTIEIDGSESSQFISALLLIAPLCKNGLTIYGKNSKSTPYIDVTIDVMRTFGVNVSKSDATYHVLKGQQYRSAHYKIEGDYSSAAFFMVAAAVTGSTVKVSNLNPHSIQADAYILTILEKMGCVIEKGTHQVTVYGKPLKEISLDMGNCPDIVPIVTVVAACAKGTSHIRNIGHLRSKESDRLETITKELSKMGIQCSQDTDSLEIVGGHLKGTEIETHNDHRIAMSMAIAALAASGNTTINNSEVVKKSFPDFFDSLKQIGAPVS